MLTVVTKACRDCGVVQDAASFSRCSSRKDGLMPYCKGCQTVRNRTTYANNREAIKVRNRVYSAAYRRRLRIETFAAYGSACACCGERMHEFLTIDHINGGGEQHRKVLNRRGWRFYEWLRKNDYPAGYRVLCWNCNAAHGAFGYCPHDVTKEVAV